MKHFLVLQYLLRETDEEHCAKTSDIVDYLKTQGIYAEPRSIYKDIEEINIAMVMQEDECTIEEAAQFAEAHKMQICQWFTTDTLTYLQRGGSPCPYDRVFASRLGAEAGDLILKGEYGFMVGYKNREIVKVPLEEVAGKLKMVDPKASIIKEAKALGISFGD